MMRGTKPPVPAPRHSQENSAVEQRPPLPVRPRKEKQANAEVKKPVESSQLEALQDFAKRKNFTEKECEEALNRTTLPADTNQFLAHLVAVRADYGTVELKESMKREVPRSQNASTNERLKNIIIDGSNVAMTHGNGQVFSCRGIQIAVDWFQKRGHSSIKVFVPSHRKEVTKENRDVDILYSLQAEGFLTFTPSRENRNGSRVTCYDDRFILDCAREEKAIVVSNDHFKDLANENSNYRDTIDHRLLGYIFANDRFMPAEDPMGRKGLTLDQFLRINAMETKSGQCPYGRKCTYGTKCKYLHPERQNSAIITDCQSTKNRQRERDLIEFIQRTQKEKSNSNSPPEPNCVNQSQHSSPVNHFESHPSNVHKMPTLVARGPSEQANGEKPPTSTSGIPNGVVLQDKILPVLHVNGYQRTMRSTTYSPQGHNPTYPPYNRQTMQPNQRPMTSIQLPSRHNGERADGLNNARQQACGSANDFTHPSHARYQLYFHLQNLFSEELVITAMKRLPNETDPKVLCRVIIELS